MTGLDVPAKPFVPFGDRGKPSPYPKFVVLSCTLVCTDMSHGVCTSRSVGRRTKGLAFQTFIAFLRVTCDGTTRHFMADTSPQVVAQRQAAEPTATRARPHS